MGMNGMNDNIMMNNQPLNTGAGATTGGAVDPSALAGLWDSFSSLFGGALDQYGTDGKQTGQGWASPALSAIGTLGGLYFAGQQNDLANKQMDMAMDQYNSNLAMTNNNIDSRNQRTASANSAAPQMQHIG